MGSFLSPEQVAKSKKRIQNPDGSVSTERSITIGTDQGFVNIPTIYNGIQLAPHEAEVFFQLGYLKSLHPKPFKTIEEAIAAAKQRSNAIGQAIQLQQQ